MGGGGTGCFSINVTKNKKYKTGWRVKLFFYIGLHQKDKALLEKIKSYLGGQIGGGGPPYVK